MQEGKYKNLTYYLGEIVDKQILMEHFFRSFIGRPLNGKIHYAFTFPGEKRSAELLYTLRLVSSEIVSGEHIKMHGAFDGILSSRDIYDQDIICGSCNAVTEIEKNAAEFGGFSIVFHTHHIRLHYISYRGDKIMQNICCYTDAPASGALLQMIQALDIIIHDVECDRDAVCRPLLEAILHRLYRELQASAESVSDHTSKLARRIKYQLEYNFYRFINCSVICDELNINRSYASQIFHRNFGITMNDYLFDLRIAAAKKLLTSSDRLKIADIAELCGFQDSGYFSRAFRRKMKCTPLEYRKKFT